MGFDDDFFDDDDFFEDDFFDDNDFGSDSDAVIPEIKPEYTTDDYNDDMALLASPKANNIEVMLLYDQCGIRDSLSSCLALTDYTIIDAYDLQTAKAAMEEHPRVGIVISNVTVGGDDATSIMRHLMTINPDIIGIICTDIIDQLSFISLINLAPIYKILTFPLDIDKELIPALSELATVSLIRRADRDDLNELISSKETLTSDVSKATRLAKLRSGLLRKSFTDIIRTAEFATDELCSFTPEYIRAKIKAFQKAVTEKYYLTLSPKDVPLEEYMNPIISSFTDEGARKKVSMHIIAGDLADLPLRALVRFVVWLLLYNISIRLKEYVVDVEIELKGYHLAYVDLILHTGITQWDILGDDPVMKSCNAATDGIVEDFVSSVNRVDTDDSIKYVLTMTSSEDE